MSTPDPPTAADFFECTTDARTKRHWSLEPTAQWGLSPLCNTSLWGFDQKWVDMNMPARWRVRKVIAEMPACKQCEKSRNRRIEGRSS